MDTQYPSWNALLAAYVQLWDGIDDRVDWDRYTGLRSDVDGETIIVHVSSQGWHVDLSTQWGDFEEGGKDELSPPGLRSVVERMRRRSESRSRVNRDRVLADLRAGKESVERAQKDLRYRAVQAAATSGIQKIAVAAAVGVSRPTLDLWIREYDASLDVAP